MVALRGDAFDGVQPLARPARASDAVALIKDLIAQGRLRPGDKLPAERLLTQLLGVSRPTIREAIQSLTGTYILEARHGSGTYVASLRPSELLRPIQFALALSARTWEQLFEVWLMIEPDAARLAAQRADLAQVHTLRAAANAAAAAVGDHPRFARLDARFHRLIVVATENDLLQSIHEGVSSMLVDSRAVTVELPGLVEQAVTEHAAIVDAISARDPDRAYAAMRGHILRVRDTAAAQTETFSPSAL